MVYLVFPPADDFVRLMRYRDTVSSVGLIPHTLPFTKSNTAIRYFRHAISLDEHRAKFQPNFWHRLTDSDQEGTKLGDMPWSNHRHPFYRSGCRDYKAYTEEEEGSRTNVREVWFSGCHCGMYSPLEPAFLI